MWSLSSLYCSGRENNDILWKEWRHGQVGPALLPEAMTRQDRVRDGECRLLEGTQPSLPACCGPGADVHLEMGSSAPRASHGNDHTERGPSGPPRSLWEAQCG